MTGGHPQPKRDATSGERHAMFLDETEVLDLTGYARPTKQIEWLRREGFAFRVAADGHPRVLRAHVFRLMGAQETAPKQKTTPNFTGLSKVA